MKFQFHPPQKRRTEIALTNIYRQTDKNSDIRYYLAVMPENLCCFIATKYRYLVFIFDKRYKFIGECCQPDNKHRRIRNDAAI